MKKITTLLTVCMAITLSSFAQWNDNRNERQENRGYRNDNNQPNDHHYRDDNNSRYSAIRSEAELLRTMNLSHGQERRIMRINESYRNKVMRVQSNRFGNAQQKRWQLERLEQQRRQEIQNVLSGFQRDRYNAWCTRNSGNNYGSGGYGHGNGRW